MSKYFVSILCPIGGEVEANSEEEAIDIAMNSFDGAENYGGDGICVTNKDTGEVYNEGVSPNSYAREVASQGCTECNRDHEQLAEWLEELKVYKKALGLACGELEDHPYSQWNQAEWFNYFLQKVRDN